MLFYIKAKALKLQSLKEAKPFTVLALCCSSNFVTRQGCHDVL